MAETEARSFDTFKPTPLLPVFGSPMQVQQQHGIGVFRQIGDIVRIGLVGRQFTPDEYYTLGAFAASAEGTDAVRAFCGMKQIGRLNTALVGPQLSTGLGVFNDKLFQSVLIEKAGLAVPETQAFFHPMRRLGPLRMLRDAGDIAAFLREAARYPLFGKPVASSLSLGIASITGRDAEADELTLLSGKRVPVETFAADVGRAYGASGYIFQTRIAQHPEIVEACGDTVGTVRVVTLRESREPEVLYAVWKIARPASGADNFWRNGNLLGLLDAETGEVTRVQQGAGATAREVTRHPDTGVELIGRRIPDWETVRRDAVAAASIAPDIRILGWDIAIGAEGPVFVEANTGPDHSLYQIAARRGIRNPEFQARFDRVVAENEAELKRRREASKARARADRARDRAALVKGIDIDSVLKKGGQSRDDA